MGGSFFCRARKRPEECISSRNGVATLDAPHLAADSLAEVASAAGEMSGPTVTTSAKEGGEHGKCHRQN